MGTTAAAELSIPEATELWDAAGVLDARRDRHPLAALYGVDDPALASLLYTTSGYLSFDDPDAIIAALATAVSAAADEDDRPLWMLIVGSASGGKTEAVMMVERAAQAILSDVTLAGLLTQRPGKDRTGLLARLGDGCNAFAIVRDMSSLLSRGSGGGKGVSGTTQAGVFEALRDIYDGRYQRDMEGVSPRWEGRVTMLAAVTQAVDEVAPYIDKLGTRFTYFRLNDLTADQRRNVTAKVINRSGTDALRRQAQEQAEAVIIAARERLTTDQVEVDADTLALIQDCAEFVALGRVIVPRDFRGQVDGIPYHEEPGRITQQLLKLARALTALNVGPTKTRELIRRVAVSCLTAERARVLGALAGRAERLSTNALARELRLHRRVVRRALEDMEAVEFVNVELVGSPGAIDDEDDRARDTRARTWALTDQARAGVERIVGEDRP
jgi:DNA-binding transcriptional regulator YhcF (GntR family)